MPRLRRSDCSDPGLGRRRHGNGFVYLDERGRRIGDPALTQRIRALAIPPAWTEVWICADERGHLQATGIDAARRKQYLYHPRWRTRRDREKFESMLEFARGLPALRRHVARQLGREQLDRDRVLACAIRLLDVGFLRIGGEGYARDNGSHGLTTLSKEHVCTTDAEAIFEFPAKSGQLMQLTVLDGEAIAVLAALRRRRGGGGALLAYRDGRRWRTLDAEEVNAELKQRLRGDFSAKDFRTWNATVIAALALARVEPAPKTKTAHRRAISAAIDAAAGCLGNTPTVCRASYVDPRLLDRFLAGAVIAGDTQNAPGDPRFFTQWRLRARVERELLELLVDDQ